MLQLTALARRTATQMDQAGGGGGWEVGGGRAGWERASWERAGWERCLGLHVAGQAVGEGRAAGPRERRVSQEARDLGLSSNAPRVAKFRVPPGSGGRPFGRLA